MKKSRKLEKTLEAWRAELSPEAFYITRLAGTERAFTGAFYKPEFIGIFRCICCDTPLFDTQKQYDAGCGWPSFTAPFPGAIDTDIDHKLGYARVEVLCEHCGAHLGHVFPDGPAPAGTRFCINSAALRHEPEPEPGD